MRASLFQQWNAQALALASGGQLLGDAELRATGIANDTRKAEPGQLFVALRAARDGHDFVDAARAAGCRLFLVESSRGLTPEPGEAMIAVDDTHRAVVRLGRALFDAHGQRQPRRISWGITGSNGKSTTKEAIGAILSRAFPGQVVVSPGNLNSQIGLLMVLSGLTGDERYLVLELGISRLGDMADLVAMAPIQRAVVTSIAAAHLEGLGVGEAAVAAQKGVIFRGDPAPRVAIVPEAWADGRLLSDATPLMVRSFGRGLACYARLRSYRAGRTAHAEVALAATSGRSPQTVGIDLQLVGEHNAMNAMAALAAVWDVLPNDDAAYFAHQALLDLSPLGGRLQWRRGQGGATLLDDAYNANPGSLRAALAVFHERPGRHWAILGDMRELGEAAPQLHFEAGRAAALAGCERVWAVGELAEQLAAGARSEGLSDVATFSDAAACIAALDGELDSHDVILIKGSRGVRLDTVVAALVDSEAPMAPGAHGPGATDALASGRA